jgi:hypothetical protein
MPIKSNGYAYVFYLIFPMFTEFKSAIEQLLSTISQIVHISLKGKRQVFDSGIEIGRPRRMGEIRQFLLLL